MEDPDTLEIKLTDFGFAKFFNEEEKESTKLGSPYYMAPEVVNSEQYDGKCDIWSTGVILYLLFTGN